MRHLVKTCVLLVACDCGAAAPSRVVAVAPDGPTGAHASSVAPDVIASPQALSSSDPTRATAAFGEATADITRHDLAGDWSDAECSRIGDKLASIQKDQKPLAEALYDAGIAYWRCGDEPAATKQFRAAVAAAPTFAPARVQLAMLQLKLDANIDAAIAALEDDVLAANYQSVDGLVNLARLQRWRSGPAGGRTCNATKRGAQVSLVDLECSRLNSARALAIDPSSAPAMNQMALYYLARARGKSISGGTAAQESADAQPSLATLAVSICEQGAQRYPRFAPIHNTIGLILAALHKHKAALAEFDKARTLDVRFFDAQMNYGDASLVIHDFARAEDAYRKATGLRPNDYGAHQGLAFALRGQVNDTNFDRQVAAAQAELDACKKIDPARPDAYYNEGILTQEFKAKNAGDTTRAIGVYSSAKALFAAFIEKAGSRPEYSGAIKKAKERSQDIEDTILFLNANARGP
jgi:tetratricopeptide (TPR) repeat protein